MNERIKELAVQAQILTDKFQEQWKAGPSSEEFFHQKFAELIVQECLEACSRANEIRHFIPPGQQQVVLDCMREIETTFWY